MLNLDVKARFKNKTFWVSLVSALVLLLQQCGLDASKIIPSNYVDIINSIFAILVILGIAVDTSTPGISDKTATTATDNNIQAINVEEKKETTESTTGINNTADAASASSKIAVDNPDNMQAINANVNAASAVKPN